MTEGNTTLISVDSAAEIVFSSLTDQGMQTMTEGGAEFVLCASALTAQM